MSGSTVSPDWTVTALVVVRRLSSHVRRIAFWLAVLLPFVYLPLAVVDPTRLVDVRLLGGFVSVNLLALVVGHGHGAPADGSDGKR
jgi:hypothetical protein